MKKNRIIKNKNIDSLIYEINNFNEFEIFTYDKYDLVGNSIFYKNGSNTSFEFDCSISELKKDEENNYVWSYFEKENETLFGFGR